MEITLLGTGSPIPTLERAGTSLLVSTEEGPLLVDCGPRTVHQLLRNGTDPGSITDLFFTHHHVDHNAAFFHFVIASWTAGRESLAVYGPDGTDTLIDALYDVYEEDFEYRQQVGYPASGIEDIEWVPVEGGFSTGFEGVDVDATPVEHSIETYGYRFEAPDGGTAVFSADTGKFDGLIEFARGADVLINDAGISPAGGPTPEEGFVWERYTEPYPDSMLETLTKTHCTPRQAAEVATEAGVETLVLTHFPPYRDVDAAREEAEAAFDGTVVVAEDLTTVEV